MPAIVHGPIAIFYIVMNERNVYVMRIMYIEYSSLLFTVKHYTPNMCSGMIVSRHNNVAIIYTTEGMVV